MRILVWAMLAGGMLGLNGCAEKALPTGTNAQPASDASVTNATSGTPRVTGWNPSQAQPKLQTIKLYVGAEVITSELALTEPQIQTGMMHRLSMAEQEGMLFVFGRPHQTAFYMRNTRVPLTAAYIDPEGVIQELVELRPLDETPVRAKMDTIQFVLEMNQGWFKRHNVSTGAVITTEYGPLRNAFH